MAVDGIAVGLIGAGGLVAFAGVKGVSIPSAVQQIIQGSSPANATKANTIADQAPTDATGTLGTGTAPGAPGATGSTGTGTGAAIAADALTYAGKVGYCYGGAMTGSAGGCPVGETDCSSFVNWVVGHDMGMAIPGYPAGTYTGAVHGPATVSWALFGNSVARADVAAGDILVWGPSVHMGIATSNAEFVSNQDPQLGVGTANIDGTGLGVLFCRRIAG